MRQPIAVGAILVMLLAGSAAGAGDIYSAGGLTICALSVAAALVQGLVFFRSASPKPDGPTASPDG